MQSADPGFRARGVLTMQTSLQGSRYPGDSAVLRTYDALLARLAALPGVEAAGGVSQLPVSSCCSHTAFYPEGAERTAGEAPYSLISLVTPGYRRALGITLLAGRDFDSRDRAGAPMAALVNRSFAATAWPGQNPLGKRFRLSLDDTARATVVGVLATVKQRSLTDRDRPQLYLPHAQAPARTLSLVVRTSGDAAALAPAVRQAVRSQDPDLPVSSLSTMDEVVRQRIFEPRVYGGLFAAFAAVALLLAAVGLYGVVSYGVAMRRHEVGVRIALGASQSDVVRLVVGGGARLVTYGLLLGVPAALLFARALRGALYGVSASDPATFAAISILLAGIALAATWLPARRAARVDPSIALRSE
jgi:putative ABC transport system permease protein